MDSDVEDQQIMDKINALWSNHGNDFHGTATLAEWMHFITTQEKENNLVVLTDEQKIAIQPFCNANPELEMEPKDLGNLLRVINRRHNDAIDTRSADPSADRHSPPPLPVSSTSATPFASRQRSSNLLKNGPRRLRMTSLNHRRTDYDADRHLDELSDDDDDNGSESHPSVSPGSFNASSSLPKDMAVYPNYSSPAAIHRGEPSYIRLDQDDWGLDSAARQYPHTNLTRTMQRDLTPSMINGPENENRMSRLYLADCERENKDLKRRLQEKVRELEEVTRDCDDRITQLQSDFDNVRQEMAIYKASILESKKLEQYHLDQIATLENKNSHYLTTQSSQKQLVQQTKSQLDEKCSELAKTKNELVEIQEQLMRLETKWKNGQEEIRARIQEREELLEIQNRLENSLEEEGLLQNKYDEVQSANQMLKEIIDRLKFDLDEARNNGRNTCSPTHVRTLKSEMGGESHFNDSSHDNDHETSAALDEIMDTEWLATVEQERNKCKMELDAVRTEFVKTERENHDLKQKLAVLEAREIPGVSIDKAIQKDNPVIPHSQQHHETRDPCPQCATYNAKLEDKACKLTDEIDHQTVTLRNIITSVMAHTDIFSRNQAHSGGRIFVTSTVHFAVYTLALYGVVHAAGSLCNVASSNHHTGYYPGGIPPLASRFWFIEWLAGWKQWMLLSLDEPYSRF
ncbi:hypothetical protein PHYBLDRAFT_184959 [Phycomyces blakesleeanus NRRL 1555(-)]|uniref:Uncharacterized protein n=1 Tax=Phycomyces blakesleeanus (strain ATCC 8743b / DSM 1359 / FGSC 10004 / NBRC 33097 / NRRL 1555) TaxID=763407 RepID=A0A167QL53_PHYB8|nr:hypothetical protein PHYBLDRAFT_184959 [Phycomyces blakesleeanus NRRL 1555(-)]OAD79868.1 hypothetical protein PHYBLDRAFT_184959 [Phycomyces blakesleeanus NRRL 1555(-)]|eukprot:XP_018297908.1 hypothetical protein PHYBLDRAFT_184959 [Phycomyces blakesleeanus NRRL 1555(-)]